MSNTTACTDMLRPPVAARCGRLGGQSPESDVHRGEIDRRLAPIWHGGSYGTLDEGQIQRGISERLGLSMTEVQAFMEDLWREYLGTPNTELVAFFRGLRPAFRTAMLSNSFVGAREREQAAYQFEDLCEFIVYSHEVGLYKPDPEIYALTVERLLLSPQEVVFVDDRADNVEAAIAFGLHAVQFESNAQTIAALSQLLRL